MDTAGGSILWNISSGWNSYGYGVAPVVPQPPTMMLRGKSAGIAAPVPYKHRRPPSPRLPKALKYEEASDASSFSSSHRYQVARGRHRHHRIHEEDSERDSLIVLWVGVVWIVEARSGTLRMSFPLHGYQVNDAYLSIGVPFGSSNSSSLPSSIAVSTSSFHTEFVWLPTSCIGPDMGV